ncbi:pentatricopeptide repeat-containing protein At1g30610, chloroplastic [Elaeis guineensis]|uniref:Pentatricopeptide repeat-containing protein At1g30610, chloroplastic n=1 Tax=Elaeis guineensis var. tenera TaxID=51953 RepID=A0A6I9RQU8_ELAGV|nr:pentatricopeptide repeat-containing protein At1g30610, chloroplastic [Elaeis guineensis]
MTMTNGQIDVFNLKGNRVFFSGSSLNSCSGHGFLIPGRPVSSITLNSLRVTKSWDFDVRKPKLRVANALANGEIEAHSTPGRLLEDEFKFNPTFNDYVKVMESVKMDRSHKLIGDLDEYSSKKRSTGKDAMGAAGNKGKGRLVRLKEQPHNAAEDIDHEENKNGENANLAGGHIGRRTRNKESEDVRVSVKNKKRVVVQSGSGGGGWGLVEGLLEKKNVQRSDDKSRSKLDDNGSGNDSKEKGDHSLLRKINGDAMEAGKNGSNATKMHGKIYVQPDKFVQGDTDDIDIEDRAAFKTFEVFTDVRNRPRVLRMEMEERIHELAKKLNATDVNMPEWKFSHMLHSAKIKFSDHSILRVVQILGAFGNWKRVLQVVQWLQSRERFKSYKSRYIYTTVLNVLGKAKKPIEALNIFYAMRQELSSYPDLAAYHCIAVTLGQAGLMKELFDVIDCMRDPPEKKFKLGPLQKWDPRLEPDLVVYNAVLNACVQQKQWEGAFWVLQQLKQEGIKPSNTTYGLVMEVMFACGKYNLVHEFFRKVKKSSIPGALNYKVLVNTLWKEGRIDEAVLAVKDMERRGVVGSASLYYDLARCLCSAGRCQEALLQINNICKVAKKPLVVTYTGLIQACLNSGSIENARYIFNQMHKFCSPNIVTCNIMLKSYIEHDMFKEAKDLFEKILDGSHHINSKTDLSHKVVPDKFTFNTMMEACAKTNNWHDFENVYQQMLNHGYHFDTRRHLHMVLGAFRAGKEQVLEMSWEHLIHFGRIPPPPIIKERFCIKLMEDEPMAAISCIDVHQEIEMDAFSKKSWLNLLKNKSSCLKKNTIVRLSHKLKDLIAETDHPHPVYHNLLNACTELDSHVTTFAELPNDQ